jgi:hypothetical protein
MASEIAIEEIPNDCNNEIIYNDNDINNNDNYINNDNDNSNEYNNRRDKLDKSVNSLKDRIKVITQIINMTKLPRSKQTHKPEPIQIQTPKPKMTIRPMSMNNNVNNKENMKTKITNKLKTTFQTLHEKYLEKIMVLKEKLRYIIDLDSDY